MKRISFLGIVISVGIFSAKAICCQPQHLAIAFITPSPSNSSMHSISTSQHLIADLPDILPPANLPINPGGVVNVPPVNRPEASFPVAPTSTILPEAISPSVFPRNKTPAVRVPAVQSIPATISQPPESLSPDLSSPPVIEFGQPLPQKR